MSAGIGQDDIDKMLNDALSGINDDNGSAQNQNDIDALFAAAGGGDVADNSPASQNDIDALLAANQNDNSPASQDDIDALLAAATADAAPAAAKSPAPANDGAQSQNDIDALLAAASNDNSPASDDDIEALLAANAASNAAPTTVDPDETDLDALLNSATGGDLDLENMLASSDAIGKPPTNQDDVDALLNNQVDANNAATDVMLGGATAPDDNDLDALISAHDEVINIADVGKSEQAAQFAASAKSATPPLIKTPPPMKTMPPPKALEVPQLSPEQLATLQDSLALSGTSGEVENISGQIAGLLGQLSEKSRRYQTAWLAAEQQARELRYLHTVNEHKMHVLAAEKESAAQEADLIRKQQSRTEGEKLAASESHRTEIAALQLRIREQESRNQMLHSESNALKEELERARNSATGADLESRRARFDAERLAGELSAERQERQRLARALDNREKEMQALQAQNAGQASTLFLDELHRLVRRLESELDLRGRAAAEALSVFDRMEFTPEMQLYAATLRASLCTAAGLSPDESDALKSLERAQSLNPQSPLEPAPTPGEDTFLKALTRYDFTRASAICSALLRAGSKTPLDCMKEVYTAEALKHPEITQHLDDLTALLRGMKNLQEASDRSRGRENENTEKVFVMMFDLLHTLVRLKLVSRATPLVWDLFLELRGRFSFLTSDRQWKEYRDRILQGKKSVNA